MSQELQEKLKLYRLNQEEYAKICELIGREPQGVEWALFSALWSEHCSYKSSRKHLKKFPSDSPRVLQSFGENAGVIDLGEGEKVAFKMESHNHPSFIEPYQGAATGVGGILRDIFTMGARPVALANYLCFGEPQAERMPQLVDGVVRGIGGYGNCVGVPTITGQTEFDASFNGNILVNALAAGLFGPEDPIVTSAAKGPGNFIVYVGAKTGRDGIHGASMASESFEEGSESKKPTVQIGDPFFEKLLIESCLEVMKQDLVVAIQDMGAAGLTSSSFEMAAKGDVGLEMELDKVPLRDLTMTPEDILLSESQERMLLVCEPEKLNALQKVFAHWDLDAAVIGKVKEERKVTLTWKGEVLADLDPYLLTEQAPIYDRPYQPWESPRRTDQVELSERSHNQRVLSALSDVRGTSRKWVYQQYDQRVGAATARDCSDSIGVVRLPHSKRALGLVLGCRPYWMRWDAKEGGKDAILYPALELAAKGFTPLAVTDCLNFGNPEKPEIMSEFVAAIEGMAEACTEVHTPVISGNVSFYNETQGVNVTSTPSTGLVGLREKMDHIPRSEFSQEGDQIFLITLPQVKMTGLYAEIEGRALEGQGEIRPKTVAPLITGLASLGQWPGLHSTRVVGKFGLPYALAKMCLAGLGCEVSVTTACHSPGDLFIEQAYQVILAVDESVADRLETELAKWQRDISGLEFDRIGKVQGERLCVNDSVRLSVEELRHAYNGGWEKSFEALA